ncbi:MAG: Spy/CpxP family protein refolding chaperone [Nitrospiria bacterium]
MKRIIASKLFTAGMFLMILVIAAITARAQMMDHEKMGNMPDKKEMMEHQRGMSMPSGGGGYGEGPFDIDMMKERLKLNDDQVARLKKIRLDYRKEMIKRRADLQVGELELWEILDSKNLDSAKAEKKVKELESLKADQMIYRIKALQETRKILTDEQYQEFRKLGFRAMRGMREGHGAWGMGGWHQEE